MISFDSVRPLDSSVHPAPEIDNPLSPSSSDPPCQPDPLMQEIGVSTSTKTLAVPDSAASRFVPWMINLAYPLGRKIVVPFYFKEVEVTGREHLPVSGPVILAPTHRSRWDAILVPYAAGWDVMGRHLRFMVSADEVKGLQGWFIRRMGGFPIDTRHPTIASLRHGVDLLQAGEVLVIFPEGDIFREGPIQTLKPGLARLALQAELLGKSHLGVKIVPIYIQYDKPMVPWRSRARLRIGTPLPVSDYVQGSPKQNAKHLTADLQTALEQLTVCC